MTTITIPIDVAEAAAEALGNFVSDHGWSDSDMQAMDNLDAYIARHKAIRAELAKPVEPVEPAAWRTFDGEGGYEFRAYEDNEVYKEWWEKRNPHQKGWVEPLYLHPPTPAWHDAPTCAGLWLCNYGILEVVCINQPDVDNFDDFYNAGGRWYGPIPQDAKAEGDAIKKGG